MINDCQYHSFFYLNHINTKIYPEYIQGGIPIRAWFCIFGYFYVDKILEHNKILLKLMSTWCMFTLKLKQGCAIVRPQAVLTLISRFEMMKR